MMNQDTLPLKDFAGRRKKLLTSLNGSVGIIFAGEDDSHSDGAYRPHPHFEYLTGITDEPGAMLLFDPTHPVEDRWATLLLRPLNPEVEKWDGYRAEISESLRETTGFQTIHRTNRLAGLLNVASRRAKQLACLHPLAAHTQPVSPDLAIFRKVAERVPGVTIEDHSETLAKMRVKKSANEVNMIQRAIDITAAGFEAMMTSIRPGMNEFEVQETIEHAYRTHGSRAVAFGTVAAAGLNSTVLHYKDNKEPIEDGDLICVDSGATWNGYCADITRTVPVNGAFTKRQREVYEIVLKAQLAAIKATKPGVTLAEVDDAARNVIKDAGYGDGFIHSIGHQLGLETHDITPHGPLVEGAVITIEPGIYLPDERIGIRIEDDVRVTKAGGKNLSPKIPKKIADIEKVMKG